MCDYCHVPNSYLGSGHDSLSLCWICATMVVVNVMCWPLGEAHRGLCITSISIVCGGHRLGCFYWSIGIVESLICFVYLLQWAKELMI